MVAVPERLHLSLDGRSVAEYVWRPRLPADETTARDLWFVGRPTTLAAIGAALTFVDHIRRHPAAWLASQQRS